MGDVLFCSDVFAARAGARLAEIAPDIEILPLVGDATVDDADLARITLAHFSHDVWPERAAPFFGVALRAPGLRWLHSMSAGVDSPVFAGLLERGVRLSNSSGSSARPIARTALMYLLALSRDLPGLLAAQARGDWAWARWRELEGRSVAVVGWGPIGREFARLAEALGMRVTAVRRSARGDEGVAVRLLDDIVQVAADHDVVVVALPLTTETEGIIDAEVLAAIGPDGLFVNVGRGELVDQAALGDALRAGRLGGAGIDVTVPEPLPADDPLWSAPNLIITPHNSGSTDGTSRRADEVFFTNLASWVADEQLATEVESSR
ncbi:MAG: D-2-hydroxyacid dehydrogenase [Actinomycetota bacterium]